MSERVNVFFPGDIRRNIGGEDVAARISRVDTRSIEQPLDRSILRGAIRRQRLDVAVEGQVEVRSALQLPISIADK